jgi:ligand-binding sensor domain-containing protein
MRGLLDGQLIFVGLFAVALHMRRLSLVTLALFLCLPMLAQELVLRALDEDRGLPSNCVLTLHVDAAGYLWVATNKGLYRYDGFSFTRIGAGTALDEVNVLAIKEVPQLALHVLVGNGARLFLLEGEVITEVKIDYPDSIGNNDVGTMTSLAVDTAMRLIAGFDDRAGQVVVDLRTRKATYSRSPSRSVGHVAQVNGQITTWLNAPNNAAVGADSIDVPAFRGRIPFRGTHLANSFKAGALSNERAWFTHQDQLHFMDRGRIITYPVPDRVLGVTEDATGRLWVRIWDHGVRCFDPSYTPLSLNSDVLDRTHVTACVQDRQGGLWFSTIDRGLFHCASSEVMFFSARRTLSAPWTSCLAGLPDGHVAIATGNGRVLRLTAEGGVRSLAETNIQGNTHEVKALLSDGPMHLYPGRLDHSIDINTGAVREYPESDPRWIGVYDLMHLGGDRYLKASIMGADVIQLPGTRSARMR